MLNSKTPYTRQCGLTLTELLVGMLISMIGILAGLALFQHLLRLSVDSRIDARHDGQLAAAMLQLQLGVQSAGYGIADAGPEHVTAPDDSRVYWRYQNASGPVCRGFDVLDEDGVLNLRMLRADCTLGENLTGLAWEEQARVARFAQSPPEVTLAVVESDCFPYGMGEAGDHYMLSVTAESAVGRNKRLELEGTEDIGIELNNYHFCLPNIQQ